MPITVVPGAAKKAAAVSAAKMRTTAFVKLFGRLHDDPIRTRRRQAYEKHQWTKSREVERLGCGGLCEADGAFKRVTPLPAAHTTGTCWYGS